MNVDYNSAMEQVVLGKVVGRASWPSRDFLYRVGSAQPPAIRWECTRLVTLPDTVADDWIVLGTMH